MSFLSTTWDLVQAATAGVFGGLIAPWLLKTGERRKLRADVRDAFGQVEYLRWADDDRVRRDFEEAVRRLETTALMARVPYGISRVYVQAARKARRMTEHTVQESFPNPVTGEETREPILPTEYYPPLRETAELLNTYLWRPLHVKIVYRGAKLQEKIRGLEGDVSGLPVHPSQLQMEAASQESLKDTMNSILGVAREEGNELDRHLITKIVRDAAAYGFTNALMTGGREFSPPLIEWDENGEVSRVTSSDGFVVYRIENGEFKETSAADALEEQLHRRPDATGQQTSTD